ncbi:hypothetical protein [Actinoplanes sp. NPDC049599]|uniref:hypothetical protein n=1 Tax=Actinoplanes sp. NPDC049599 TaxID=3363903 RepID=UPI0037A96009
MTNWQTGMRLSPARLNDEAFGTEIVSFTSLTSTTIAVAFGKTFTGTLPQVFTEINSGAGSAARWGSRAINITATGFTLFLFVTDAASAAATWASVPVGWRAYPTS